MTTPSYTFGISEFTTYPWSFEQDVANYARLGVHDIEVTEFKLDAARIHEQLSLIPRHGLNISSAQPAIRTLFPSKSQPEPRAIPDRMGRFRKTIEDFGDLASGVPFVTNTGIPPGGNIQEVMDTATKQYRDLADFAQQHQALVALEPLNASIVNIETAIWELSQGMRIVHAVDRPNFGICLDYWNIWQNANIDDEIRAAGDRIFVVQLSDWRTPRSFEDRLVPGQGSIPLPALLRATHDSGYRGPYVVEIFSDHVPNSLWKGNLDLIITESRQGVDRAWERAFAPTT